MKARSRLIVEARKARGHDATRAGRRAPIRCSTTAQCRGVAYDCYDWAKDMRTKGTAHNFIAEHWHELSDGDVIDVQIILGETDKTEG